MTSFFGRTWQTKTLIALLLFIAILVIVFIFRRPIAIKSIEHFSKAQNVHIGCLDFSFNWPLNLDIKKACATSSMGEVLLKNVIWQPWSNDLSIERVQITHLKTITTEGHSLQEPAEQQTTTLDLPDSLPSLKISSLQIDSYALRQPIALSVMSISPNTIQITGDLNTRVELMPNNVSANLEWHLSDLTKFIPEAQQLAEDNTKLLQDAALDKAQINTKLTFDGKVLYTQSNLNIASRFNLTGCPIDAVINGDILANVDLKNLDVSLDISQLSNTVSAVDCSLMQEYLTAEDSPQLSLELPQPVTINATHIHLPELNIIDLQTTDKPRINRTISLQELNIETVGQLNVSYDITLEQPIANKQVSVAKFDFQGEGKLFVDFSSLNSANSEQAFSFKIFDDKQQFTATGLQVNTLSVAELSSEFYFNHSADNETKLQGIFNSSELQLDSLNLAQTSSTFSVTAANINDFQLSLDNQFAQLKHTDFSLQKLTNRLYINLTQLNTLNFSGTSSITNLTAENIKFQPIMLTHTGLASLQNQSISTQHKGTLEHDFLFEIKQQNENIRALVEQQEVIGLQSVLSQLENDLVVKTGKLSAHIELALPQNNKTFAALGQADFQNISVKYQDYLVNNINYQPPLLIDSAGLQLTSSSLHIDSIDVGVMATDITANVIAKNSELRLRQVSGELFAGQFSLANLWLDGRDQQLNVNFENIDLSQIMALQQQPGINITGKVNGDMPMAITQQGIKVDNGWMSSLTGGKLTIVDNPSFDSIKAQQPELALLENLDFTQLESNVKFTPDGWVLLDIALQGNNPDKNQGVNFNYSHEENLYSLLESIRLVNAVDDTIEKKINQGDKK